MNYPKPAILTVKDQPPAKYLYVPQYSSISYAPLVLKQKPEWANDDGVLEPVEGGLFSEKPTWKQIALMVIIGIAIFAFLPTIVTMIKKRR